MSDIVMQDANPTHYLKRVHRDTPPLQFVREIVQNGIEANATEITIRPKWFLDTADDGLLYNYSKMMITDNGDGMTASEMYKNCGRLNASSKSKNSECNENYGIGAKITTAMWNKHGIVFLSWHKDNPDNGHLLWLHYNQNLERFCLRSFTTKVEYSEDDVRYEDFSVQDENGFRTNVYPLLDSEGYAYEDEFGFNHLTRLRPKCGHGTVVLLLGNSAETDTWTDSEGNSLTNRDLRYYLNTRYSKLRDNLDIKVYNKDGSNPVKVLGFERCLESMPHYLQTKETVVCPDGFEVDVYITKDYTEWKRQYKLDHGLSETSGLTTTFTHFRETDFKSGFLALEYDTKKSKELLNVSKAPKVFYKWGINVNKVAKRVKIIVRPPQLKNDDDTNGVFQNEGRYMLLWKGENRESKDIDLTKVQDYFVNHQPQALKDLLEESYAGYQAKGVDSSAVFDKYKGVLGGSRKKGSLIADENGDYCFNPSRSKGTSKGSIPKKGTGIKRRGTGEPSANGSTRGRVRKARPPMAVDAHWVPYIEGADDNVTDAFLEGGVVYPAYVEIRDNRWKVYLMKNHPHFLNLASYFYDQRATLPKNVIEEHIRVNHEMLFDTYLLNIDRTRVDDKRSYTSHVVLHSLLMSNTHLWDRIGQKLATIGK